MTTTFYDRFDPNLNYERVMFRNDRVLQSAELNELQSAMLSRQSAISNILFKNGDLIRDAGCTIDDSGLVHLAAGALYLSGAVRNIGPASFAIATVGIVVIGVYLQTATITELDDESLLNPAVGTRGYMEPGAARQQINPVWGVATDAKDGQFYPVYEVVDGALKAKEAPPTIDAVTVAIQKYDRESTGGSYVVNGLNVKRGADFLDDKQTYIIAGGVARVTGKAVTLNAAVRHVFSAAPDLKAIESEPHVSTSVAKQRINVDYAPIASLDKVVITMETTVQLNHGAISGGLDPLPDTAVLQIMSIKQGTKTYTKVADYKLTAGKVDWSPNGAEPATGSTYLVTYQHITTAVPTDIDSTGFSVTGAVVDSLIEVSYHYKVPRVDRLCINESGDIITLKGIASDWLPVPPSVPANLLLLATIYQAWKGEDTLSQDAPRMVPMADLAHLQGQLDGIRLIIAAQQLRTDAAGREAILKKSLFVDPLLDDSMRDAGVIQSGAIVAGALCLPITLKAVYFGADVANQETLAHNVFALVEQSRKTGSMAVNPYQSFTLIAAQVTLEPAVDQMTYVSDMWNSAVTSRMTQRVAYGSSAGSASSEIVETVSTSTAQDQICRVQTLTLSISGFGPNEALAGASFDGIAVAPGTLDDPAIMPVADAHGVVTAKITIPSSVPAGRKLVQVVGSGGSFGAAYYTAASWSEDRVLRRVVTEYVYEYDPAPTPTEPITPPQTSVDYSSYVPQPALVAPSPDPIAGLVATMYNTYLGRDAEPDGLAYWTNQLSTGTLSSDRLLETFMTAAVYHQEQSITPLGAAAWDSVKGASCAGSDPLAQTLVVPAAAHLVGIDLWFVAVGSTDVVVHLRTVSTGLPTKTILAEAKLKPSQIKTDGTPTQVLFERPYYATVDEELAFVVMCNDAETALSVAELGEWDGASWITAQPYTIGVLLSSSNNSTWTAHQDKDIQFRLLAASYTETARDIDLGEIDVSQATDLMILGLEEKPGTHSTISYAVTLPDGTVIAAASNQPLALSAPVTGKIRLRATLRGDAVASPVLHRGGQLLVGWLGAHGDYVSRAMQAGVNSRVRVVVDALLPSGSALAVQLKGVDQGDVWSAAIPQIAATSLDNGWHELTYEATGVNEAMIQAKAVATGTAAARPFVRNVRMMVM